MKALLIQLPGEVQEHSQDQLQLEEEMDQQQLDQQQLEQQHQIRVSVCQFWDRKPLYNPFFHFLQVFLVFLFLEYLKRYRSIYEI